MKKFLLLLIEFLAITLPLTWYWMNGGEDAYLTIYKRLAFPLLQEVGVANFAPSLVRDRFIGFIPYFALLVITPGMSIRRRLLGLGGGFLLIFCSHMALTYWSWVSFVRDGQHEGSMAIYFPALVAVDAVPFVLWAGLANQFLLEQLSRVLPASPTPSEPIQGQAAARDSAGDAVKSE
jgi:hypothetical protein